MQRLATMAIAVIKAKGIPIPTAPLPNTNPPVTASGWFYNATTSCGGVKSGATYMTASDGSRDLSMAFFIPIGDKGPDVMVAVHDLGADGTADFSEQTGDGPLLPDQLTHELFYGVLDCVIKPLPPKKK
ncbi:MAG: hypothetical protein AAB839_02380 [Patescibacteria group bacterium]